ncbi:MinD/ParA family ATP-binding protein [Thermococcus barophilus]|uniref:Septum site-determining MinD-like protein n=1 Tax=Thermococcus barophilus TaxID=55802 RepID=A0A0S1XEE6_THEBA|nr:MinD/ParA family protein [Thermococcus barophilus]ALM76175.1 Septum site-determining MinD-like protein [Thermococcus barophilus]
MTVVVITGRGGAGKTTLTSNLGVYFARNKYKTLVIDGDLYLPKLGFHFSIDSPRYSIHNLLRDPTLKMENALYRHKKTGVYIIPGSAKLRDIIDVPAFRLKSILHEITDEFSVIFVDSPTGIPFDTLHIFELADYQIIVIELERSPIYSAEVMIQNEVVKLKSLGDAFGLNVAVVLNKVRESSKNIEAVIDFLEDEIDVPVIGVIPFDHSVPHSVNMGVPILEYKPRSRVSRRLRECGEILEDWMFGKAKVERIIDEIIAEKLLNP